MGVPVEADWTNGFIFRLSSSYRRDLLLLVWTFIAAAYGKEARSPPDEAPAHCRALCDPVGLLHLAHGYLGSALKVFLHLPFKDLRITLKKEKFVHVLRNCVCLAA